MLPVAAFVRQNARRPDPGALALVGAVLLGCAWIVGMPLSATVRDAALARFHLERWGFAPWAMLQPVPSMYNFENRWMLTDVVFTATAGSEPACRDVPGGFVNHYPLNPIELRRSWIARCIASATLVAESTYRGTALRTAWRIEGTADGFRLRPSGAPS